MNPSETKPAVCHHPLIGVGAIVIKNDRLLLGLRKGSHGAGTWCPPGGHLEFGESLFACAGRETLEETSVEVRATNLMTFTEDFMPREDKHFLTHFIKCTYIAGDPQVMEPKKLQEVGWVTQDQLWDYFRKGKLFSPIAQLLGREFDLFAK
nr:NUDIX domain protein [uncultured bacterium]